MLYCDNVYVHRAAANSIDFKTREIRGSVCNPLLCRVVARLGGVICAGLFTVLFFIVAIQK